MGTNCFFARPKDDENRWHSGDRCRPKSGRDTNSVEIAENIDLILLSMRSMEENHCD